MARKELIHAFETSPWAGAHCKVPAKLVTVSIIQEHFQNAKWTRFCDPVSMALNELLNDGACADVFWNSDSFGPRYYGDEARIGFHIEDHPVESHYYVPLPRRTADVMWKLRRDGFIYPFSMKASIPVAALADHIRTNDYATVTRQEA